jgi:signal transduction histidine kinase
VRLHKGHAHFDSEVLDRRSQQIDRVGGQRAADFGVSDWKVAQEDRFRLIEIDDVTEQRVVDRDSDEELRPYSVLVVEDTPDVTRVIRLALHHEFKILAAADGKRGLEMAREHKPTVIITDLMMPELDGLGLVRLLREDAQTQHIPIIMLTARSDVEDRVAGLESGVNAYLAKPFSVRELTSVVRAQLTKSESTADAMLSGKLQSLQTLAGGLAHEIKNPINYITNSIAIVRRDMARLLNEAHSLDEEELRRIEDRTQRMFDTAEAGVQRIAATIELMLRYSRDGYPSTLQPYDVYAAVRDVRSVVLSSTSFELQADLQLEGNGWIDCLPDEFNQALTNLIENAVHALPQDGSGALLIRGHNDGNMLELTVRDNGCGISADDLPRIFNAFYTTKGPAGTGRCRTIAHRVVTALGGSIQIKSQLQVGTEVVVRVPSTAPTASGPPGATPA